MAGATESTVSAILKEVYPGAIEDELNNEVALWAILEKQKVSTGGQGKHFIRPMRVQRAQGFGARNDTDSLPNPGNQGLINATINIATNYFVGQVTGRVIRTSFDSDAAFMEALEAEMTYGMTDYITEMARQIFNGAGQLTTLNGAVSSSTSVTVVDSSYLGVNEYVEFWNGSTNETTADSGQTGTKITAISGNTITVTTAQTLTTGDIVARAGNNTSATATKELNGLDVIVDDGTDFSGITSYYGITRSSYPVLYGQRLDIGSSTAVPGDTTTTLSENKLQYGVDQARKKNGGYVDLFVTDYDTRRRYANLLQGNKRYPLDGVTAPQFAGGFERSRDLRTNMGEGLSFDGAPLIASRLAPGNKMWGLDTSSWKIFQQSEIEWVMNGDSILHPLLNASSSQDGYRFAMFYDAQLYCEAPGRNVKFFNTKS